MTGWEDLGGRRKIVFGIFMFVKGVEGGRVMLRKTSDKKGNWLKRKRGSSALGPEDIKVAARTNECSVEERKK